MNDLVVKSVDLFGDTVIVAQDSAGNIWVGVRWICEGLGMTEGHMKRQIANIKKDLTLSRGGSNLILNKGSGEREVFCLKLDYVPLWLAKVNITPTIQAERPELADKLLEYQLKAKDVLADAFITNHAQLPKNPMELLELHYAAIRQVDSKVNALSDGLSTVRQDLEQFKDDLPLLGIEESRITRAVKKKGVECLGGKQAPAYKDKSLRARLYCDLHQQLRREFDVSSYKAIRRSQADTAVSIIQRYTPPLAMADTIRTVNAQQTMEV